MTSSQAERIKMNRKATVAKCVDVLATFTGHKLARKVGRHVAATCNNRLSTFKPAMRELIRAVKYATPGSYEMTVEGILAIKEQQRMQRNQRHLAQQIERHRGESQLEMLRAAQGMENTNCKGGMAPGHTPAISS